VPIRIFYPALLTGKVLRDTVVAIAGFYSFSLIEDWYGGAWDGLTSAVSAAAGVF